MTRMYCETCLLATVVCLQVKFQKRAGSASGVDDQRKEMKCDPREQLNDECFQELLALAKDISQYCYCC